MESMYDQDTAWLLQRRPELDGNEAAIEAFCERVAIGVIDGRLSDEMARQIALQGMPE